MRKILLLLVVAVISISCIDDDYDLSNVDTDNTTIGGDESVFLMPLASVEVSMSELKQSGPDALDIEAIFDEVDIWLPTILPNNDEYLDISRLTSDSDYIDAILTALFAQMSIDEQKMNAVLDLVWDKYSAEFMSILFPLGGAPTEAEFKEAFRTMFDIVNDIKEQTKQLAAGYLTDIEIGDIKYDIGKIDLGSDIVDMLAKNLDPKGTANPKNTLHIYGDIESMLPLSISLAPLFTDTDIAFEPFEVNPNHIGKISEERLYEEDLRRVIEGVSIVIPIALIKYYPKIGFDEGQKITMTLRLKKCGGLNLNL